MATNVIQAVQGDYLPDLPYTLTDEASGVAIDLTGASGVTAELFVDTSTRQLVAGWPRTCAITAPATGGNITIPMQSGDTAAAGTFDFEFTIAWTGGRTQTTVVRALFQVQSNPNLSSVAVGVSAPVPLIELTTANAVYVMTSANGSVWVEAPNVTVILPPPAILAGRRFSIGNLNQTSTLVKTPSAGATLNGQDYSITGLQLGGAYDSLDVETDGTVYRIV